VILSRRPTTLFVISLAMLAPLGCGKKGPPLAPFVRVPSLMTDLVIQRIGDEVWVGFSLPTQNQDGTQPADLERVDIYAMTVQPHIPADRRLELEEFQEEATLVTSIKVAPPPATAAEEPVDPAPDLRPRQGLPVAFSETMTTALLVPVDPWDEERRRREREEEKEKEDDGPPKPVKVPLMTPPLPGPLERRYAVVGVSSEGHESEPVMRIAVPLVTPPYASPTPVVTYDEEVATIVWELPVGVRRSVQITAAPGVGSGVGATTQPAPAAASPSAGIPGAPAAGAPVVGAPPTLPGTPPIVPEPVSVFPPSPPPPLASTPIVEWPRASRYELFEIVEADEGPLVMPRPLHLLPLAAPTYPDTRVEFGVERCYAVVTLDVVSELEIRSDFSAPTCVTFLDTFAPAAPTGLNAVGSDGAVSLSWEPNEEEDLVGYLVLRGVAPGETLLPLTAEPVRESTYRDSTALPGVRYVYTVQAVDDAVPPNISLASETFDATAR
jgi:hypothetical protein